MGVFEPVLGAIYMAFTRDNEYNSCTSWQKTLPVNGINSLNSMIARSAHTYDCAIIAQFFLACCRKIFHTVDTQYKVMSKKPECDKKPQTKM